MDAVLESEPGVKSHMASDAVESAKLDPALFPLSRRSAWAKRHLLPRDLRDVAARLRSQFAASRESFSAGATERQDAVDDADVLPWDPLELDGPSAGGLRRRVTRSSSAELAERPCKGARGAAPVTHPTDAADCLRFDPLGILGLHDPLERQDPLKRLQWDPLQLQSSTASAGEVCNWSCCTWGDEDVWGCAEHRLYSKHLLLAHAGASKRVAQGPPGLEPCGPPPGPVLRGPCPGAGALRTVAWNELQFVGCMKRD